MPPSLPDDAFVEEVNGPVGVARTTNLALGVGDHADRHAARVRLTRKSNHRFAVAGAEVSRWLSRH